MSDGTTSRQLTLFAVDSLVRTCHLPATGRVWLEADRDFGLSCIAFLESLSQDGLLSKTSPVYCPPMKGETLRSCLEGLPDEYRQFLTADGKAQDSPGEDGMESPGGCWTLNISEWPSAGAVCSLSQVLEMDAPQKYYLSPTAARGILRRAERRRRQLPAPLHRALVQLAESIPLGDEEKMT